MAFRLLTHRFQPSFLWTPTAAVINTPRRAFSAGPVQTTQPPKVLITGKWQIKQKVLSLHFVTKDNIKNTIQHTEAKPNFRSNYSILNFSA